MAQEIKYTHEELVTAVERLQELGDYDKQVDASKKAGEILNDALDELESAVRNGVSDLEKPGGKLESGFDKGDEFKL